MAELAETASVVEIIESVEPTHIFNFAGSTSVERSWQFPTGTANVLGIGPIRLFDADWKL